MSAKNRKPRRASAGSGLRKRRGGEDDPIPYPDAGYPDVKYADWGKDYIDSYEDWHGHYRPSQDVGQRGRYQRVEKLVLLKDSRSVLLEGDPDNRSSAFDGLGKDEKGSPVGVLPVLLNEKWFIQRIIPYEHSQGVLVILVKFVPAGD